MNGTCTTARTRSTSFGPSRNSLCSSLSCFFFFNDTATTEIYTSLTLFPYTTLFRSSVARAGAVVDETGDGGDAEFAEALERSEEHTSELQSRNDISYAVFCLKKK